MKIYNQFTEQFSVNELAEMITEAGKKIGLNPEVISVPNPRTEMEEHYYNAKNSKLQDLGLEPINMRGEFLEELLQQIVTYKDRVDQRLILPGVNWKDVLLQRCAWILCPRSATPTGRNPPPSPKSLPSK